MARVVVAAIKIVSKNESCPVHWLCIYHRKVWWWEIVRRYIERYTREIPNRYISVWAIVIAKTRPACFEQTKFSARRWRRLVRFPFDKIQKPKAWPYNEYSITTILPSDYEKYIRRLHKFVLKVSYVPTYYYSMKYIVEGSTSTWRARGKTVKWRMPVHTTSTRTKNILECGLVGTLCVFWFFFSHFYAGCWKFFTKRV